MPTVSPFRSGVLRRALTGVFATLLVSIAAPSWAQGRLPEPYVSPALDAVLMPITPAVKEQFKLPRSATGVALHRCNPVGWGNFTALNPAR